MKVAPSMNNNHNPVRQYLFKVDILIEEETNGRALEILLHHLNSDKIKDYRITSGLELGRLIQSAEKEPGKEFVHAAEKNLQKIIQNEPEQLPQDKDSASGTEPSAKPAMNSTHLIEQMLKFKEGNKLIRLTVVKGKGVRLNMPCRIINFDPLSENVTIYHVDEKKVYSFQINEIDDVEVR
jgi:hypothetical protein